MTQPGTNAGATGAIGAQVPGSATGFSDKKLKIYRDLFDEVITRDVAFGSILKKVKAAYEEVIVSSSSSSNAKLKNENQRLRDKLNRLKDESTSTERRVVELQKEVSGLESEKDIAQAKYTLVDESQVGA